MSELIIDQSTIDRIAHLRESRGEPDLLLRIGVEGGGCSGFQYLRELITAKNEADHVFSDVVVTDDISLPLLNGATIRYEEKLVGAEFVIDNPNAVAGCGCGVSFAV